MLPNRKDSVCLQRSLNNQKLSAVPCMHNSNKTAELLWVWTSPGLILTPDETQYICLQKNNNVNDTASGYENTHLELCAFRTVS